MYISRVLGKLCLMQVRQEFGLIWDEALRTCMRTIYHKFINLLGAYLFSRGTLLPVCIRLVTKRLRIKTGITL